MMKRRSSMLVALVTILATVFVALVAVSSAQAEENFTYKVRVFPGNRGTLKDDPVVIDVSPGGNVNLYDEATATITDSKYVQTGFRQSGSDIVRSDGQINGVGEDMDFVVAYGVEANLVPYTIEFVEYGTGKQLAEPKNYYGTDGEKPVASYEYIDGYRPRYLAITGTLHKGEDNVWTFEYIPLEEGETIVTTTTNTTTTYVTTPGAGTTTTTTTTAPSEGGTTTTTGTTGGTETGATGATEGTQGTEGTEGTGTEGTQGDENTPPQTQEILDLDTPMAGPDAAQGASKASEAGSFLLNPVLLTGVGFGAAAVIGVVVYLALRKKGEKKNEEA